MADSPHRHESFRRGKSPLFEDDAASSIGSAPLTLDVDASDVALNGVPNAGAKIGSSRSSKVLQRLWTILVTGLAIFLVGIASGYLLSWAFPAGGVEGGYDSSTYPEGGVAGDSLQVPNGTVAAPATALTAPVAGQPSTTTPIPSAASPPNGTIGAIGSFIRNANECIDATNAYASVPLDAPSALPKLQECSGSIPGQQWRMDIYGCIRQARLDDMCLQSRAGTNTVEVQTCEPSRSSSQQWMQSPAGHIRLRDTPNRCLEATNVSDSGSSSDVGTIQVEECQYGNHRQIFQTDFPRSSPDLGSPDIPPPPPPATMEPALQEQTPAPTLAVPTPIPTAAPTMAAITPGPSTQVPTETPPSTPTPFIPSATPAILPGSQLQLLLHEGKCVEGSSAGLLGTGDGALQLWACGKDHPTQSWRMDLFGHIRQANRQDKCIHANGTNGTVDLQDCSWDEHDGQQWMQSSAGHIRLRQSPRWCLSAGNLTEGSLMELRLCEYGNSLQLFSTDFPVAAPDVPAPTPAPTTAAPAPAPTMPGQSSAPDGYNFYEGINCDAASVTAKTVSSAEECGLLCEAEPECNAYSFKQRVTRCYTRKHCDRRKTDEAYVSAVKQYWG